MSQQTALITGATSGIGAEFARRLAGQGYSLILSGRREERLRAFAAELAQKYTVSVEVVVGDLTQPGGIETLEAKIAALPDLSILVNNAGFGVLGNFAQATLQSQLDMIQVHILSTVRLTHAALPGMLRRKQGAIINVSSVAAFLPFGSGSVTYNATKTYLNMFTQTLHDELRGSGVRVQALCPGFTYTEFHDRPGLETFSRTDFPRFAWLTPEKVVDESLRDLKSGRVICVPGFLYKVVTVVGGLPWTGWIIRRFVRR